jgi:hypothetical protein
VPETLGVRSIGLVTLQLLVPVNSY